MANPVCRQHPNQLTPDHVSRLAILVDERIGTLIGDAAMKSKVADLAPWYELRGVIAQMQESTGAKTEEKKAKPPRNKPQQPAAPQPLTNPPVIPADTGGVE